MLKQKIFAVAIVVIEMQLNLSEIVSIYSSHNAHRPITRSSFEKKNQQIKRALSPGKYGKAQRLNISVLSEITFVT